MLDQGTCLDRHIPFVFSSVSDRNDQSLKVMTELVVFDQKIEAPGTPPEAFKSVLNVRYPNSPDFYGEE